MMNEIPAPSATAKTIRSSSGSVRASGGQGARRNLAPDLAPGAGAMRLGPPDERLALEIARAHGRATGQPVPARQHAYHRLAPKAEFLQPRILERRTDEADVDLARVKLLDVEHGRAEAEAELDLGVASR